MLVVTRKNGESIRIRTPDNHIIDVMITKSANGQVKVGIDAPVYYNIAREELLEKPQKAV